MSELTEIYKEVILDHNRSPRNFGKMEDATSQARGHNPLCGDEVTIYVRADDDTVEKVSFEGSGCAICVASSSLMTECLKGQPREKALELYHSFHKLLTGDEDPGPEQEEQLGKLVALAGVRTFPIRVKCATLAWHTFEAALKRPNEKVSTE